MRAAIIAHQTAGGAGLDPPFRTAGESLRTASLTADWLQSQECRVDIIGNLESAISSNDQVIVAVTTVTGLPRHSGRCCLYVKNIVRLGVGFGFPGFRL
jgi:hypothetical protein